MLFDFPFFVCPSKLPFRMLDFLCAVNGRLLVDRYTTGSIPAVSLALTAIHVVAVLALICLDFSINLYSETLSCLTPKYSI